MDDRFDFRCKNYLAVLYLICTGAKKMKVGKHLKLTKKLMLGIGIILFITFSAISLFFYYYVKHLYLKETYRQTELLFSYINATVEYVKDELRPKMFHVLPKDEFIQEAMSTTFVTRGITKRFVKKFPEYNYRRVAIDPRNSENMANELEKEFLDKFSKNPNDTREWKGLIRRDEKRYFVHQKAVVMEAQCLICHGDPSYAPRSLVKIYGKDHGFYRKIGNVAGVESVAVPVDETFYQITQIAFSIFILGLSGMAATFLILNYFHYMVLVKPLRKASSFFKSIVSGEKGLEMKLDVKGDDEISEVVGSFNQMISHLKRSQDELVSSEMKYRRIFEGSKDAILLMDCAGPVRDVNQSGVELWGYGSREEFIQNLSLYNLFTKEAALNDFLARIEKDEFVKDYETVFKKRDAREMNVLITATLRKEAGDHLRGYECIVKDITERKRMEERIREADKLASLGQLAAGVAHEINNPLSIILGFTRLLAKKSSFDMQAKEDLETIHSNAESCKKIVEDLLNFSRQKRPQHREADMNQTIESIVTIVETQFHKDGITTVRDYDASIPPVTMDIDKMKQVYMNILMNAYQATDSGGSIRVSTHYDQAKDGIFTVFSDTGCGIPKNIQTRVFEPFFTTKEPGQGTGLGLAVCYGIIQEHHGEISFESEEGKGATFKIWLPLNSKPR
jgi:PAS domain S-box-containing protein